MHVLPSAASPSNAQAQKQGFFRSVKAFPTKKIIFLVLFCPLYGESTLIKILRKTKARTISHYLSPGQSRLIIYSQAIRASASQKLITQQAGARNAYTTKEYSLVPGRSLLTVLTIFMF